MKTTAHGLVAAALVLLAFGWWGLYSPSGRARFDEMAGIIPFGAGVAGIGCVLLAVVLYLLAWKRGASCSGE